MSKKINALKKDNIEIKEKLNAQENRKLYAHPNPMDTDKLEKACDKFYGKYPGLTDLYKGYMKYYELVRPADDE